MSPAFQQAWQLLADNRLSEVRAMLERLDRQREPTCRQGRCLLLSGLVAILQADFLAARKTLWRATVQDPGSATSLLAAHKLAEVLQATPVGPHLQEQMSRLLSRPGAISPGLAELRATLADLLPAPVKAGSDELADDETTPRLWLATSFTPGHPLLLLEQARHERLPQGKALPRSWHSSPHGTLQVDPGEHRGLLRLATTVTIAPPEGAASRPGREQPWSGNFLLLLTSQTPLRLRLTNQVIEHYPQLQPLAARRRFLLRAGAGTLRLELLLPLDAGTAEIGLRLLPLQAGCALRWLTARNDRPPSELPRQTLDSVVLHPLPELADDLAEAGGADDPSRLLVALAHWQDGRPGPARQLLQRLVKHDSRAALWQFLLAMEILEDDDIPPPIDEGQARSHLRLAAACRQARLAGFRLALLQAGANQQRQAMQTLRRLDRQRPGYFLWPYFQAVIAEQEGWTIPAVRLYRQALRRWPENPDVMENLARLYLEQGNLAAARPLARKLWAANRPHSRLELLKRAGRTEELDQALWQLLERDPAQPELWLQRARLLLNQGQAEAGRRCLRRSLAWAGDRHPDLLRRAAGLLDQAGLAKPARQLWQRLQRLQPWRARLRLAAAIRAGEEQLLLDGESRSDAQAVIEQYRSSGWQPSSGAVRVLDHYHLQAFADGSSLLHLHQVIHVRTRQAVERWGEFTPPGDGAEVLALHTLKPDGRTFQAQVVAGKDTVSLPHLAAGDFIEMDALVGQKSGQLLAASGWVSPVRRLGGVDQPVFRWETSYVLPAAVSWRLDRHGRLPRLQRRRLGKRTLLRLVAERVEARRREPLSPAEEELLPSLVVGFAADWNSLRRELAAELRSSSRSSSLLADQAAAICGDETGRECARRIFHWVCANIGAEGRSDNLLEPASHILMRRQGNRLTLLVALLRAQGWQPRVVLARAVDAPALETRLPRPGLYSQPVVAVAVAGKTLWLVPDGRWHPFDSLDAYLLGAPALSLWPERGPVFVRLPERHRKRRERRIELELELGADGSLRGRGRESIPAGKAAPYREILAGLPAGKRRRVIEASLVDSFSTAELEQVQFIDLEQPDRPLVVEYRFQAPSYGIFRTDRLVLPGRFFPYRLGHNLRFSLPRSQPLLIGDETRTSTRVLLTLPPGWHTGTVGPVHLRGPLRKFSYRREQRGRQLLVEKHLLVRAGRLPAASAADFQHFCRQIDRLDTQPLEFSSVPVTPPNSPSNP